MVADMWNNLHDQSFLFEEAYALHSAMASISAAAADGSVEEADTAGGDKTADSAGVPVEEQYREGTPDGGEAFNALDAGASDAVKTAEGEQKVEDGAERVGDYGGESVEMQVFSQFETRAISIER